MKKALYLFILLLVSASSFSQAPQGISYQAVVRNVSNVLVSNATVSAFITIQKDSANGSLVYGEIDNATTNANGLFSVVIGKGQSQIGSLSNINWGNGVYYIRSAIDPAGGTNRTIVGSSQILSVPYALYAANGTASGSKVGDMQYWDGTKWTLISAGTNGSVLTLCNGVPTWGGCGVVASLPTLTTPTTASVTSITATLSSNVTADGGATVTSRGFCYSTTSTSPTLSNSNVLVGSGTGAFSTTLSALVSSTTYYVTAYATNSVGTTYSTPVSFTTLSNGLAIITTATASSITSNSVVLGGNITSDGGNSIISRGVCYSSTTVSPTLANSNISIGSGTGFFSTIVSGLNASTTYYVVAYATNSLGITTYGTPISFNTGSAIVLPTVTASSASSITSNGAALSGNVTANGGATVTSNGFCYSTTTSTPTLANSVVAVSSGTGTFSTTLTTLLANTTYYVTAYATNSAGTAYSSPITFTTISNGLAIITTSAASSITSNSVVLGGNITSDGGYSIISRGVCYSSTTTSPTLANSSIAVGNGIGSYSTYISALTSGTTYYAVAYATNSLGITTYGTPISFNTSIAIALPTVTTSAASSVSSNGATLSGNVSADGGANVTSNGFCYSTTTSTPTLANSVVAVSSGTGTFSTTLNSLLSNTTYYVTAYATNSAGTAYSTPITFTTTSNGLPTITTSAASTITSNSAVLGGNITNDGGYTIISRGVCYSSTNTSPTLANSIITIGNGLGSYNATVSGLTASTTYYVVAYATNSLGITTYGTPVSFITSSGGGALLPSVANSPASSVTSIAATLSGNVTADGGSPVTLRGFCYSTTVSSPTLFNSSVTVGSGTGSFSFTITGLTANTTYFVTAYATNSVGTTYSTPISFTTTATTTNFTIGQAYGGGTIFYLDGTGHGLIAALNDQGTLAWDLNNSGGLFTVTGATDTSLGSGLRNTNIIKTSLLSSGSYAANMATQTANGYSDWYLPSLGELQLMYINLASAKLGNLSPSNVYWSSSEYSLDASHQAWVKDFGNNSIYGYWKSNKANVRAVRKF